MTQDQRKNKPGARQPSVAPLGKAEATSVRPPPRGCAPRPAADSGADRGPGLAHRPEAAPAEPRTASPCLHPWGAVLLVLLALVPFVGLASCTTSNPGASVGPGGSSAIGAEGGTAVPEAAAHAPAQPLETWTGDPTTALLAPGLSLGGSADQPWVTGFTASEEGATWVIEAAEAKAYDIKVRYIAGTDAAFTLLALVDGFAVSRLRVPAGSVPGAEAEGVLEDVFLPEGRVVLTLASKNTGLRLLGARTKDAMKIFDTPPLAAPVNPRATPEARAVMAYLAEQYGKAIISGQQDLTWNDRIDMVQRVFDLTGKKPALQGFDFLNYTADRDSGSGTRQVEEAIAWWNQGGLVAFCWHWRAGASREFYTNRTDFRINLDPSSAAYKTMIRDIDHIAGHLKRLQDAGVPVLWRPLHEAAGRWFWWGASGGEANAGLWRLMYDRMVNHHGLNNLIWVWNGQEPDWYPGDDTVDIIGWDIYGERNYSSWKDTWLLAQSSPRGETARMVALTENGAIPDPDNLVADGVPWSWFMTWNDGDKGNRDDDFWSGDKFNEGDHKIKVYNHPYVITLDEVPDFKARAATLKH